MSDLSHFCHRMLYLLLFLGSEKTESDVVPMPTYLGGSSRRILNSKAAWLYCKTVSRGRVGGREERLLLEKVNEKVLPSSFRAVSIGPGKKGLEIKGCLWVTV